MKNVIANNRAEGLIDTGVKIIIAVVIGALILGEDILKIQYLVAFILISGGICISNFVKKKD